MGGGGDKTQLEEETLAVRSNSAVDPDGGQQEALFVVFFKPAGRKRLGKTL